MRNKVRREPARSGIIRERGSFESNLSIDRTHGDPSRFINPPDSRERYAQRNGASDISLVFEGRASDREWYLARLTPFQTSEGLPANASKTYDTFATALSGLDIL